MQRHPSSRHRRALAVATVLAAVALAAGPALAQDEPTSTTAPPTSATSATTATTAPPDTTPDTAPPDTTPTTIDPNDPTQGEGLEVEPVPAVPVTVPPRPTDAVYQQQAARLVRQSLSVAKAEAVKVGTSYAAARQRTIELEAQLDVLEASVTQLATADRTAVRRVEAARRHFEARAATATVRGRVDDFIPSVPSGSPNEMAMAKTLLGSVLDADQTALQEYLVARAGTNADLLVTADHLVEARRSLSEARTQMVDARRANVAAQVNLAVLAAGSDIVIHGFVFPVGTPHSFGDSFGAPRMLGTQFAHAHQGTDIMAPMGTPLVACERGIVSKIGTDSLGGNKLWLKGESGTFYYYAHLSRFADGLRDGQLVDAGTLIGYVGDTGNAQGGAPHLHFEIHPDGGAAVNPYPLLKVVDQLNREAGGT
jgi:murein DD-endopeptidase MepM/ murein hydrolase activator NlpD